jgi:CheY-like chemotaxis protein
MGKRQERRDAEVAAEAAALAEEAMVVWRVMSWYGSRAEPVYGAPVRCPDCGALSLVLKVDTRERRCRNRCSECSREFFLTERAMEAVASGRLRRPEGLVLPGDGLLNRSDAPDTAATYRLAPLNDAESVDDYESTRYEPAAYEPSPDEAVPEPQHYPEPALEPEVVVVPDAPEPEHEPELVAEQDAPEPEVVVAAVESAEPSADRAAAASRAREATRRLRREAAAARRAKVDRAENAPAPMADLADDPDEPPSVRQPEPVGRASLFSAPAPPRVAEEPVVELLPLLRKEAGARVATPEPVSEPVMELVPEPQPAVGPQFGAVVVSSGDGGSRLVDPSRPVAPVADLAARRAAGQAQSEPKAAARGPLRVLLVEDDPSDAAVVTALLTLAGPEQVELRVARSREAGQAAAQEFSPDVVLLDLDLPDSHGLATITRWCFADIPGSVVVMSGEYNDVIEARGREQGVAEFLPKSILVELLDEGEAGAVRVVELLENVAER